MNVLALTADDTLTRAYAEGRADEHEEWLPLADLLDEKFRLHQVDGGFVVLPVEAVMELSIALERAKRRN